MDISIFDNHIHFQNQSLKSYLYIEMWPSSQYFLKQLLHSGHNLYDNYGSIALIWHIATQLLLKRLSI